MSWQGYFWLSSVDIVNRAGGRLGVEDGDYEALAGVNLR